MKILQVIPYFWPSLSFGGPVKVVYQLSRELSKRNGVSVYTSDAWDGVRRLRESEKIRGNENFKVFYFRNLVNYWAFKLRFFTNFGIVTRYLKEMDNFDTVHINDVFSLPQILLAEVAKLNKKIYFVSTHGVEILDRRRKGIIKFILYKLFVKRMLENAKAVIATSEGEAKILQRQGLGNVKVVFNGVSLEKVVPSKHFEKYHKRQIFTILYIGRINVLKGLRELIDAAAKLRTPFQILIAGPDDGLQADLVQKIKKHSLQNKVHFLGYVNEAEKKELFKISDVFVYPSKLEGFSISILEAMENGLPVIITEACNFPDVAHFRAGFVIPTHSVARDLSKKVEILYRHKNLCRSMAIRARELIESKYSIGIMTKNIEKIYIDLK